MKTARGFSAILNPSARFYNATHNSHSAPENINLQLINIHDRDLHNKTRN